MADQDDMFDEGDVGVEEPSSSGQKRVGFLGGMLIQVLKWVGIILGGIIFIVTVVVVTLRIMNQGNTGQQRIPVAEEYASEVPVLTWYSDVGELRGSTNDDVSTSFIILPHLGYDGELERLTTELIARRIQFVGIFNRYFGTRTTDELEGPENQIRVERELLEEINRILRSGQVRDIVFEVYQFLPL